MSEHEHHEEHIVGPKQYGMVLMDESLVRLVREGRITRQTACEHAENLKWVNAELA